MTYEEAVSLSMELRTRFNAPFSTSDKQRIESLYEAVFLERMKPTSCQNCYHDALIRIFTYLKREGKMREKCNYRLRAGFIIHCPNFRRGKIYTNYNLTDEVAEEYLAMFPQNTDLCERITAKPGNKPQEATAIDKADDSRQEQRRAARAKRNKE